MCECMGGGEALSSLALISWNTGAQREMPLKNWDVRVLQNIGRSAAAPFESAAGKRGKVSIKV